MDYGRNESVDVMIRLLNKFVIDRGFVARRIESNVFDFVVSRRQFKDLCKFSVLQLIEYVNSTFLDLSLKN